MKNIFYGKLVSTYQTEGDDMLFLLIIMEFSIYTLQFVKIFFVSTHQVEGEEHDWEYHATVFVYITSPHAEDLQNNQSWQGGQGQIW